MDFTAEQLNIAIQAVFNDDGSIEEVRKQLKQVVAAYDEEKKAAQETKAEDKRAAEEKRRAATDQKDAAREQAAAKKQAAEEERAAARAAAEAERRAASEAKENAAAQAAAHAAMAAAAVKAFDIIRTAVNAATAAYNEYQSAVKGLNSIAVGKGIDTSALENSLASVTDAMFDATAAAASFKNLLSRGYSLDQATNTILRLKDAAAFGRQANYSLADAVKSATEGIKNENSILVDNAGVTKNVAKMWQDYAKARGITTDAMTQAQKVEAEYLGIMQETALQVGDYEKSLDTLAGTQAKAANSAKLLATSYGEAMAPAVGGVTDVFAAFMDGVRSFVDACPDVSAGLTATALGLAAVGAGVKAAQAVSTLGASLSVAAEGTLLFGVSVKTAFPALALLSAVVGVGTAAFTAYKRKTEEAKQAQEEETRSLRDSITEKEAARSSLAALAREYTTLSNRTNKTEADKSRLLEIEQELAQEHGIVRDAVLEQAGAYDSLNASMEEGLSKSREEIIALRRDALEASLQSASENGGWTITFDQQYAGAIEDAILYIKASLSTGLEEIDQLFLSQVSDIYKKAVDKNGDYVKDIDLIDQFIKGFDFSKLESLKTAFDSAMPNILGTDGILSDDEAARFDSLINAMVSEANKSFESMRQYAVNGLGYTSEELQALDAEIEKNVLSWLGLPDGVKKGADGLYMAADAFHAAQMAAINYDEAANAVVAFDPKKPRESVEAINENYMTLLKNSADLRVSQENLNKIMSDSATPYEQQAAALALQAEGYGWLLDNEEGVAAAQKLMDSQMAKGTQAIAEQGEQLEAAKARLSEYVSDHPELGKMYDPLIAALTLVETQTAESFEKSAQAAQDAALRTVEAYNEALPSLNEMLASLGLGQLSDSLEDVGSLMLDLGANLDAVNAKIAEYQERGEEPPQTLIDTRDALLEIKGYIEQIGSIGNTTLKSNFDPMTASAEDLSKELASLEKQADKFNKTLSDKKAFAAQVKGWKDVVDAYKDGGKGAEDYERAVKGMAETLGYTGKTADDAASFIDFFAKIAQDDLSAAESEGQALAQAIWQIIEAASNRSEIDIDTSAAEANVNSLLATLGGLSNFISGLFGTGSKGSGGGKSKAEREAEEAERAAQEAARAQEEAYRNALSRIDHKREMDEISAQEEIDLLREVQRVHAQTDEQRMDISERIYKAEKALAQDRYDAEIDRIDRLYEREEISAKERIRLLEEVSAAYAVNADLQKSLDDELYNARQELREQETGDIDRLGDGVTTALRARYEEQRDAEREHLEASKKSWADWSDETCAAIQAQIDALDEQQEAEDRQKTDANNLRAIDKAKQALAYETDEYNRRNLEKQIAQLEEKRAEQLKKWEVADKKDELRDEMEAIRDKAEAEQKAIDEEIERVNALYEERLKAANIQAEAERMLMKGNQEQILDLIASYAPDYEATGKTLGERLFEGIQSAVGSFADWYAAFTDRIEEIQYSAVQGALEAADRLHASGGYANAVNKPEGRVVNVTQNLTFNQPIERPSDVARRVEEMGLELADMM